MHDFDAERLAPQERDRSFKLGGKTFTYRTGVRPEVLARYFDGSPTGDNMETLKIYDDTVVAFLEDGQADLWQEVRTAEGAGAVTLADIRSLIDWLIEEQVARPTGQQSNSSNGFGSPLSGTDSTVVSASPEPVA